MITLKEHAYAKLNLTLDVLCKRPDSYHDLESVMQAVSLQDEIEIDVGTGRPWKLCCDSEGIPLDEKNLAWKAAAKFFDSIGESPNGWEIRIIKRIPSEAGLGGGSADAAAVLRALNRCYGDPLSIEALADLGATVGSDVPFCVYSCTAMVKGRGEKLHKLADMPSCWFVICKPYFSSSTPELYRKLDDAGIDLRPDNEQMVRALRSADLYKIARLISNVFDPIVSVDHREIEEIKLLMQHCGAIGQQMTGSGSAVFGVFTDLDMASAAQKSLMSMYDQVYIAKPVVCP